MPFKIRYFFLALRIAIFSKNLFAEYLTRFFAKPLLKAALLSVEEQSCLVCSVPAGLGWHYSTVLIVSSPLMFLTFILKGFLSLVILPSQKFFDFTPLVIT